MMLYAACIDAFYFLFSSKSTFVWEATAAPAVQVLLAVVVLAFEQNVNVCSF